MRLQAQQVRHESNANTCWQPRGFWDCCRRIYPWQAGSGTYTLAWIDGFPRSLGRVLSVTPPGTWVWCRVAWHSAGVWVYDQLTENSPGSLSRNKKQELYTTVCSIIQIPVNFPSHHHLGMSEGRHEPQQTSPDHKSVHESALGKSELQRPGNAPKNLYRESAISNHSLGLQATTVTAIQCQERTATVGRRAEDSAGGGWGS